MCPFSNLAFLQPTTVDKEPTNSRLAFFPFYYFIAIQVMLLR